MFFGCVYIETINFGLVKPSFVKKKIFCELVLFIYFVVHFSSEIFFFFTNDGFPYYNIIEKCDSSSKPSNSVRSGRH